MISQLVRRQRTYYHSGATRSYGFRMEALAKLKQAVLRYEVRCNQALQEDLNKSACESYLCEIGIVLDEIRFHQKHLRSWMKERRVPSAMGQMPGHCVESPEPYGVTLILAPWNYPIHLCLVPLIGAISGGNTAILKPSADAPASSKVVADLIAATFPPDYIAVVEGDSQQYEMLLAEKLDYIFFTGSTAVGKQVAAEAAKQLVPLTLELGGKSPVIVDETANLSLAARRIAFGKVINGGQTCVEPDYLLIHETVQKRFVECYRQALAEFFPTEDSGQMVTMISPKHYERIKGFLTEGHTLVGGGYDDERRYIQPTLLDEVPLTARVMQEEIFGPVLPLFPYRELEECIDFINGRDKPLALYLFSKRKDHIRTVLNSCSFGGGCINDTLLHLINPRQPFGGVGASGIGSYHGKKSFDTFTHVRSIFQQSGKIDLSVRYPPFTKKKLTLLRKIMR